MEHFDRTRGIGVVHCPRWNLYAVRLIGSIWCWLNSCVRMRDSRCLVGGLWSLLQKTTGASLDGGLICLGRGQLRLLISRWRNWYGHVLNRRDWCSWRAGWCRSGSGYSSVALTIHTRPLWSLTDRSLPSRSRRQILWRQRRGWRRRGFRWWGLLGRI